MLALAESASICSVHAKVSRVRFAKRAADATPATGLKAELEGLRLGALCVRAARVGVEASALDDAEASAHPI